LNRVYVKSTVATDFVSFLGLAGLFGRVEIFVLKKAFRRGGVDGGVVAGGTGRSIELFIVVPGITGEGAEEGQRKK
jgi:hypothetical protein